MMDLQAILIENLKSERRLTRETIVAMADGDMAFRPTAEQMCFGAQALHLLSAWETLRTAYQGRGWEWDRGLDMNHFSTHDAILAKFDEITEADLAFYGGLEPAEFTRIIETPWGAKEPLTQMFIGWLAHEAHHRGQMVTYLRLKGMQPPKY